MGDQEPMLPISENLFFKRSDSPGEGKTRGMAKGLILCDHKNEFAGECAGFGLPVFKTDNLTMFPSLFSSTWQAPGVIDHVYRLNLVDTWSISGRQAPTYFSVCMEKIVDFYMKRPYIQQPGLKMKQRLFKRFQILSRMKPGMSVGACRVRYQACDHRLTIRVDASALPHLGNLILLNEVPGTLFSTLISDGKIKRGDDFLPWQTCSMETTIETPDSHMGFSLSFPVTDAPKECQIAAGREVGRNLNWSGLSITTKERVFTYHVNVFDQIGP
ncbi:MAG: hypothetical protein KKD44_13115 [Proteobacteria bacterium]|nr:hypothetical protein [Pseudomonadota bacterium]